MSCFEGKGRSATQPQRLPPLRTAVAAAMDGRLLLCISMGCLFSLKQWPLASGATCMNGEETKASASAGETVLLGAARRCRPGSLEAEPRAGRKVVHFALLRRPRPRLPVHVKLEMLRSELRRGPQHHVLQFSPPFFVTFKT